MPLNNVYLCRLTSDKEILQWLTIYHMHNNIKSIGMECIGIYLNTQHTNKNPLLCYKYCKALQRDIIAHNQLAEACDYKL